MFDFALDEVETIRTLLREELRPSIGVTIKTRRRRYSLTVPRYGCVRVGPLGTTTIAALRLR